ncbi:MAG: hypothetical protein GY870_01975, partial [archaeon]|nr:hypothetical protein [archaeon]
MINLKTLIQGKFSKKFLTHRLMAFGIGSLIILLLISRLLYPQVDDYPYNWMTSMISRLGWPDGYGANTIGWYFFSAAFIVLGLICIPFIPYTYRRFSKI